MADSLKTLLSGPVAASPQEARRWDTLECCHHFVGVAFKHQRAKIDFTMSWEQACPGVARASVLLSKKDKSLQKIFFFLSWGFIQNSTVETFLLIFAPF